MKLFLKNLKLIKSLFTLNYIEPCLFLFILILINNFCNSYEKLINMRNYNQCIKILHAYFNERKLKRVRILFLYIFLKENKNIKTRFREKSCLSLFSPFQKIKIFFNLRENAKKNIILIFIHSIEEIEVKVVKEIFFSVFFIFPQIKKILIF